MNLSELRSEIEKIDAQIVELLNRRTEVSIQIGKAKRRAKSEFFAPAREKELLQWLSQLNRRIPGPLKKADLHEIYREIFSRSRAHQKPLKIGYVGSVDALLAARRRFGSGETYQQVPTAKALAEALRRGKLHAGIAASVPKGTAPCDKIGAYRLVVAPRSKSSKEKS